MKKIYLFAAICLFMACHSDQKNIRFGSKTQTINPKDHIALVSVKDSKALDQPLAKSAIDKMAAGKVKVAQKLLPLDVNPAQRISAGGIAEQLAAKDFFRVIQKENLSQWDRYNPSRLKNHPEYGILPVNAPCADCVEALDKRTATQRYFRSTTDTTKFYVQNSLGDINFLSNGNWLSINKKLKPLGRQVYESVSSPEPVGIDIGNQLSYIKTPVGGQVSFNRWKLYERTGDAVSELDEANWSDYSISEDGLFIRNIFKGIDASLTIQLGAVKTNFIIRENAYPPCDALLFRDDYGQEKEHQQMRFETGGDTGESTEDMRLYDGKDAILHVGKAVMYPENGKKTQYVYANYELGDNKVDIVVPYKWITDHIAVDKLIIDPLVTGSYTLAQASITGSRYNGSCNFTNSCDYTLNATALGNATITDIRSSFAYSANGSTCWQLDGGIKIGLGANLSPATAGNYYFCNQIGGGTCNLNNSVYTDLSPALPAPSCADQNLTFTLKFYRSCWGATGCDGSCIGAASPWIITIEGHTVELKTPATPFIQSATTAFVNQPVNVNATSTLQYGVSPYIYSWSLNASGTPMAATGATAAISFPTAGNQSIYLFTYDACGNATNTSQIINILENDPDLHNLQSNPATTLSPAFNPAILSYNTKVAHVAGSINFIPTIAATSSVQVNNQTVISGNPSASIPLSIGSNTIPILVTAQDGLTTKNYSVQVIRNSLPVVSSVSSSNVTQAQNGQSSYNFTITYSSVYGSINPASILPTNVSVKKGAALLSITGASWNAATNTATYTLTPLSSAWQEADNGSYTIDVNANQVADDLGDFVAGNTSAGTFTVVIDNTAPPAPVSLTASSGEAQVTLNWTANTDPDLQFYRVYAGTAPNPTSLLTTVAAGTNTYLHNNLINGTTWYYRISAIDLAGNESPLSNEVSAIPHANQFITINSTIPNQTYGNPTINVSGLASASSLLAVQYSVQSGPASLTGTNLTLTGAGTVTLAMNQPGNINFNPAAQQTLSFTVDKATPIVNWANPAAITFGTALSSVQLNAASTTAGTFSYNPAIGTMLNAGLGQTLSVTFNPTDAIDYNPVSKTINIDVNKANPVVNWNAPAAISFGTALSSAQLNATSTTPGAFTYSPVIGTTLNTGPSQTLSVTFDPTDITNYNPVTKTVSLDVNKINPIINWNNPAAITFGTALSPVQLNAASTTAGTFSYNPAIGTMLNAGLGQTLSVTFNPTDGVNYSAVTKTASIDVNKSNPVVNWNAPAAISFGAALSSAQLNATSTTPGSFTYSPLIGTILNAGPSQTLSVTFDPTDITNYNPVSKTVSIDVNKINPVINWNNPAAITFGTALSPLQLNATSATAGTFNYSPAIGTALSAGLGQTLSVTFSPTDAVNYNPVTKTISLDVNKGNPVVNWSNPAPITFGTALSPVQLNATSAIAGTFNYSSAIGTILSSGLGQTLSVTFSPSDAANYNPVTKTVSIDVNKINPVVNWNNPAAITFGTALSPVQLNAVSTIAGTFNYSPAIGTVLSAGLGQTLSVTFNPTDAVNYNPVTKTISLDVNKANPAVNWSNPAAISFGTPLSPVQLNATSATAGTFNYSPAIGTVLSAGLGQTLSVTFNPTDAVNYNPVTKTISLNVNKANPVVTWSNPEAIIYGTSLSITELNATSSTAGTFNYSPSNGTILNAGNAQNLSVNFIPADAANYNSISKTVVIDVSKATPIINWNNPAAIAYGTSINSVQLNAAATTGGTFTYSPGSDTFLNAGLGQILSVTFNPSDASNMVSVTKTVNIDVLKANLEVALNSMSRCFGLNNPAFSLSFTGFVRGENATAISLPSISTSAQANSIAGEYPVILTGGSAVNYNLQLVNGKLIVNPLPLVNIQASRELNIEKGTGLTLIASGGTEYLWNNASGIISGQNTEILTIRPEQTTVYTVNVKNAAGCAEQKSITVFVNDFAAVKATNILTPNGDGINDYWLVSDIEKYPNNKVKVFDKAGRLIFSQQAYKNTWAGTKDGNLLTEGTYYYVIDLGNGKALIRGYVTIVNP